MKPESVMVPLLLEVTMAWMVAPLLWTSATVGRPMEGTVISLPEERLTRVHPAWFSAVGTERTPVEPILKASVLK